MNGLLQRAMVLALVFLAAGPVGAQDDDYVIGIDDVLQVMVWGDKDLDQVVANSDEVRYLVADT